MPRILFLFCLNFIIVYTADKVCYGIQDSDHFEKNSYQRSMEVQRTTETPTIDGKLNEPAWEQAAFYDNFLQREPHEGKAATEKTKVAILYDQDNLYIGACCFDSEPDKIHGTKMQRDEMLFDDDYFDIILDTFHDKRNAFFFTTNPLGLRRDGTVSEEGKIQNSNWDGVWQCKTSIDDKGWYVEIAIPWQTLRFKEGDDLTWGANFVRRIQRKNEDDYWRLVPLYAGRNGRFRMSEAGEIHGFDQLKMKGKFEIKPFIKSGLQNDNTSNYSMKTSGDFGGDVKFNLSSKLTADITYNTDFAQVEADQEQVNLTRFSLFFPEKRDFFLEGAETFTFGQSSGRHYRPEPGSIQLFHSRRIGIEHRQPISILGGARLNGKVGRYTLGLLSIQTEKATMLNDDDEEEFIPQANYSVIRLKRNIFSRSSMGFMLLNKQDMNGYFNRSFGLDSNFPVNENFSFFILGAGTYASENTIDDEDLEEGNQNRNNFAGNVGLNWESDLWEVRSSYLDIQEQFNPEIGFIRRTDIRKLDGRIRFSPRPQRLSNIRKFEFAINGEYQTDHQSILLNRKFTGEFNIQFESGARFNLDIEREYEFLDEDWEIRDGFNIPLNGYSNSQLRLRYNTDRTHKINGRFNINIGKYFTGTRNGGGFDLDLKASNRLNASLQGDYNLVKLPEGQFHTTTLSSRITYSFSPDFFIKGFLQFYDDKLENDGRNLFSANIVLRYIYRPGSDFYLVFNQESLMGANNNVISNRVILAKINYFLRR